MEKRLAIDLGSTNCMSAVVHENGRIEYVENSETGAYATPSYALICEKDGKEHVVLGDRAKEQAVLNPEHSVSRWKRMMGSTDPVYDKDGKTFTAQELSAMMLKKKKEDAESYTGTELDTVVITVPEEFDAIQRDATKKSGEMAGFRKVYLLTETAAAAKACSEGNDLDLNGKDLLCVDVGGATTDISGFHLTDKKIVTKFTSGNLHFAGAELDEIVMKMSEAKVLKELKTSKELNAEQKKELIAQLKNLTPFAKQELSLRAEMGKEQLSKLTRTSFVWCFGKGEHGTANVEITREEFVKASETALKTFHNLLEDARKEAEKQDMKPDLIVLTGGTANVPMIQDAVKGVFQDTQIHVKSPETTICRGAALFAAELSNAEHDHGAGKAGEERVGTTRTLVPVCNRSYGVEVIVDDMEASGEDHVMISNLLYRNTELPAVMDNKTYYTRVENQSAVLIRIYESNTADKELLEIYEGTKIAEAKLQIEGNLKKGSPILVSMRLDEERILHVKAVEESGHTHIETSVKTTSVMSDEDVEKGKEKIEDIFDRAG